MSKTIWTCEKCGIEQFRKSPYHFKPNSGVNCDGKFVPKKWVCLEELDKWIADMQIGGTILMARTPILEAQKKGEMMMLRKIRNKFFAPDDKKDEGVDYA